MEETRKIEKQVLKQVLACSKARAEQLSRLKPNTEIVKKGEYYVINYYKEES